MIKYKHSGTEQANYLYNTNRYKEYYYFYGIPFLRSDTITFFFDFNQNIIKIGYSTLDEILQELKDDIKEGLGNDIFDKLDSSLDIESEYSEALTYIESYIWDYISHDGYLSSTSNFDVYRQFNMDNNNHVKKLKRFLSLNFFNYRLDLRAYWPEIDPKEIIKNKREVFRIINKMVDNVKLKNGGSNVR